MPVVSGVDGVRCFSRAIPQEPPEALLGLIDGTLCVSLNHKQAAASERCRRAIKRSVRTIR